MIQSRPTMRQMFTIVIALLSCALLAAQDSKPLPAPPVVSVQAASANSAQANGDHQATASVLCFSSKPTTHVEGDILNEASAVELHQYLEGNVLPLIRGHWYQLTSRSGDRVGGEASVEFDVLKDGSISSLELVDGAGHAALGDLAMSAVKNSAPLPPMPPEFAGKSIRVRSHFFYDPGANAPASRGRANGNEETPAHANVCKPDEIVRGAVNCMVPPKPTYNPEPQFSPEARQQKRQGVVTVSVVVAHDGNVQSACVDQPLGYGLDEQAVDAVRSWKFTPATLNGQPVAIQLLVEVDFHLSDKADATDPDSMKAPAINAPSTPAPEPAPSDEKHAAANAASEASTRIATVAIGKGVTPPRPIFSPTPDSAHGSGPAKYSGTVTLQLVVSTEGKAEEIKVLKSLGPGLDQKAIDALRQWKFQPAMKDGQPVATQIEIDVDFHLY